MKYRSISLNENGKHKYSLVKYTDEYKHYLEELRKMNRDVAYSVEICSQLYSELSEHQSYMIFRGNHKCVGGIIIETSTDEKDLEVKIQLNEEYFDSKDEMYKLVEQIAESLKLYFFNKEHIEIVLNNGIDLSEVNGDKYQKKFYDENLTTYTCSNQNNNILFSRIFEEMNGAEKCLTDWGQFWWQQLQIADCDRDIQYPFDEELVNEITKGTVTLSELFNKVESVLWSNINSANSSRNITFSRNGQVEFSKNSQKENGINYTFCYNVLSNDFSFKTCGFFRKNHLDIEANSHFVSIKSGALNIMHSKDNKRKRITYETPIVDSSSIMIELWTNEQDEVERCYIDFRTHKGNGKISGIYTLRLFAQYDIFSLRFISRKGDRYANFSQVLAHDNEGLYSTILSGHFTIEIIDKLIKRIIPLINRKVTKSNNHGGNKKYIAESNETLIPNLIDAENQALNFVKQIKGEIPLPHLQEIVEGFIEEYDKGKKSENGRKLQKPQI